MLFLLSDFNSFFPPQVIVSDNGSPSLRSTATVVIRVLDANDNQPRFTDKLSHVKLLGQRHHAGRLEVCRMVARDDDEGSNALVTYKLQDSSDERFHVNPLTGVVTSQGDFWPGNYSILTVGIRLSSTLHVLLYCIHNWTLREQYCWGPFSVIIIDYF